MIALARFLSRDLVARIIVVVSLALTALSVVFALRVEQDDNVLEFLPKDTPEVRSFYEVSERFGSLDVALVGVASNDAFQPDFLGRLKKATKELNDASGVEYALSLTNVDDYKVDKTKGIVETGELVDQLPANDVEIEALRLHAIKNQNVVGNLVAKDSKGVVVYCFLRHGQDPHVGADQVRKIITANFPGEDKFWGGSPFISTYIYDVTQKDLKKLAPFACLVIIALIVMSFRDWVGVAIALASTGMGIGLTLGLMGLLGVRSNIVLGSMPVILFALGSAPPVHILTRYYFHRSRLAASGVTDPSLLNSEALVEAIRDKGLVVVASAATVVAGLGSFITMDIAPMRVFGVFTSLGIIFTLLMAVIFVPAAIRVFRLKGKPTPESAILGRATAHIVALARRYRLATGAILVGIATVCAFGIDKVDTRMDNQSFFDPGSEPDRADHFLHDRFGGSLFVQVWVKGDMKDPYQVREVQRLADKIAGLPRVASVAHIGQVLSAANDAIGDHLKAIPNTGEKIRGLYPFVESNRAVSQLVDETRTSALLNVKLSVVDIDGVEAALTDIQKLVKAETIPTFVLADANGPRAAEAKLRRDEYVLSHIVAEIRRVEPGVDEHVAEVERIYHLPESELPIDPDRMKQALLTFLLSEEFAGDFPEDKPKAKFAAPVADEAAKLPAKATEPMLLEAVAKGLGSPITDEAAIDVAHSLFKDLGDIQRSEARGGRTDAFLKAAGVPKDSPDRELVASILSGSLSELELPKVVLPATEDDTGDGTLWAEATGLPVLYRGLSQSVEKNQIWSLLSAVVLVAITMTIAFRSIASGILSAIPALFTIVAVYGGMGLAHIHLDIGTSMLASLIIGAGVDYAIHYLGAWRSPHLPKGTRGRATPGRLDEAAHEAAEVSGPGIWTNALMVAAGFFVLTLGEARPLKHVGTLTAVAMVVASLSTFLLVPIFAKKHEYVPGSASTTKGGSPNG